MVRSAVRRLALMMCAVVTTLQLSTPAHALDTATVVLMSQAASAANSKSDDPAELAENKTVYDFSDGKEGTVTRTQTFPRDKWVKDPGGDPRSYLICPGRLFGSVPDPSRCRLEGEGFLGTLGHTEKAEPVPLKTFLEGESQSEVELIRIEEGAKLTVSYREIPGTVPASIKPDPVKVADSDGQTESSGDKSSANDPFIEAVEKILGSTMMLVVAWIALIFGLGRLFTTNRLGAFVPHASAAVFFSHQPELFNLLFGLELKGIDGSFHVVVAALLTSMLFFVYRMAIGPRAEAIEDTPRPSARMAPGSRGLSDNSSNAGEPRPLRELQDQESSAQRSVDRSSTQGVSESSGEESDLTRDRTGKRKLILD
jgi:hypothetical protein